MKLFKRRTTSVAEFKIAIGGHACHMQEDADLFLHDYSDHIDIAELTRKPFSKIQQLRTKSLINATREELTARLSQVPASHRASIYTTLQGTYSQRTVPLVLNYLKNRSHGVVLHVEPSVFSIRQKEY